MARQSLSERTQMEANVRENMRKFFFSGAAVSHMLEAPFKKLREFNEFLNWELENREDARRLRNIKNACFPLMKSLDDYRFDELRMPESITRQDMIDLKFIDAKHTLVFYGICGSGKTMLSIALGIKACNCGYRVRFVTLSQLATRLIEAKENGRIEKVLADYRNLGLLIIDEWGYRQLDKKSSEFVFQVIAESYEKKSLILTTNLPFSEWGKIVADEQLAAAMIDRIVHFGHLIDTGTVDWRLRLSPMNHQMTEKKSV
jgi:DNA replication protein DnaC